MLVVKRYVLRYRNVSILSRITAVTVEVMYRKEGIRMCTAVIYLKTGSSGAVL